MYVPTKIGGACPRKNDYEAPNVQVIYSGDFRQLDRVMYHRKRRLILSGINRKVPLENTQLVHAHFLFSAGGVALELKRTRGIPYVVAVRNTDVNVFFKYAFHLRAFGFEILREASAIVFLSPAYRNEFFRRYPSEQSLRSKSLVLPNGIDDFWHENRYTRPPFDGEKTEINFTYVGAFTRNKNVVTTLKVIMELKRRGYQPHITLVGDGPDAPRIHRVVAAMGPAATIIPWTESRQQLLDVYRRSDMFLMPSFTETFGLVYAEAMSQGLPVVYSRGQGIDGYFPDGTVGYACNPHDVGDIADKIEAIIRNYDHVSGMCTECTDMFSWSRIASQYESLYQSILTEPVTKSILRIRGG